MNRKGAEKMSAITLYRVAMLAFAAILVLGLLRGANNAINDTTYWRTYYAKDIGLLMDTMMADRGDINIDYDFSKAGVPLKLQVSDEYVTVQKYNPEQGENAVKSRFRYAKNLFSPIYSPDNPWKLVEFIGKTFKIIKKSDSIEFIEVEIDEIITCSNIDTYLKPEDARVYIIGEENIANYMAVGLKNKGFNAESSSGKNAPPGLFDGAGMDLAIELKTHESTALQFYYAGDPEKANKLICIIQKKLIEKYPGKITDSITIHMTDTTRTSIGTPIIGLIVYVNELNVEVAQEITKGVIEYYGRSR